MIRRFIIEAEDSLKGCDEAIDKLVREWGAEEIEPCEDCISREAVRRIEPDTDAYPEAWNKDYERGFMDAINMVLTLPSVTPIIPEVENDYNIGYNCGYADAMSDVAEMRGDEE